LIEFITGDLAPNSALAAPAAGAFAVLALLAYYAFTADGCIVPKPKSIKICISGIVEQTVDLSSTAVLILAPFALGPNGAFDVVVKSKYWDRVTENAFWVFCSKKGAAVLRCIVKDKTSCAARVGSLIGGVAGAVAGVALGFLASLIPAALSCAIFLIFAWLCFLIALIVSAIVAAATTYVGAVIGGWLGVLATSLADDPVGDEWHSISPGTIVTVRGDWTTDPDVGNNELFYTTAIHRTGQFATPPSYTTADADSTADDDCGMPLEAPS